MAQSRQTVLIVGAGIAGLTAALAFAAKGYFVRIFERAEYLEEFGAGLQISPNASRILDRLGVLEPLCAVASRPDAIRLVDASTGRQRARMPLGASAENRWGAPYLVVHRADLQATLLAAAKQNPDIDIVTGAEVTEAHESAGGIAVSTEHDGTISVRDCGLLIAADGVWSSLRAMVRHQHKSRYSGYTAWRALTGSTQVDEIINDHENDVVTAYLSPKFHLVAYPVKGGQLVNLVTVISGTGLAERWAIDADVSGLRRALSNSRLERLAASAIDWTAWPIHEVDPRETWSDGKRMVLIGDAAHAMTPFGAQGAAMAIEDAFVLAECVDAPNADMGAALARFEALRKPRIERVARRSAFNRFTWHASGPVAFARNLALQVRSGDNLMRDFDWLYGFDPTDRGVD